MVKFLKYSLIIIGILLANENLFAQKFYVSTSSNKVGLNQRFQLTYTAEGKASNFKAPDFNNFQVLSGPNQSSRVQINNGQFSQSISYSYILTPLNLGTFTIKPASIKIDGEKYTTKELKITVVDEPQNNNQNSEKNKENNSKSIEKQISDNLFIKASISKSAPYQGEQIILTYKLYQSIDLYQLQITLPKYTGFWAEEVEVKTNPKTVETVNGKQYHVQTFQKTILFPQKSGKITIEPLQIDCIVKVQSSSRRRSPFDDFFDDPFFSDPFGRSQNYQATLRSNPVTINVKPLPENKPIDFNGLVGSYNLSVETDKTETKTNAPITMRVKINGKGNLKLAQEFDIDLPADIETYEPKTKENISINQNGVSGTKSFEYLLIPRLSGSYKIPGLSFSYFDPQKEKYIKVSSNEMNINVLKGEGEEQVPLSSGLSKKEIELRGKDIQFIRMDMGELHKKDKYFFGSLQHIIFSILPIFLFIIILLVKKRIDTLQSNVVLLKQRKATLAARKRLKEAGKYLKQNNQAQFYSSTTNALLGYASDKFNIAASELTKDNIKIKFSGSSISEETLNKFTQLLDNCDFARYAPSQANFQMTDIYNEAIGIISSIEKELK